MIPESKETIFSKQHSNVPNSETSSRGITSNISQFHGLNTLSNLCSVLSNEPQPVGLFRSTDVKQFARGNVLNMPMPLHTSNSNEGTVDSREPESHFSNCTETAAANNTQLTLRNEICKNTTESLLSTEDRFTNKSKIRLSDTNNTPTSNKVETMVILNTAAAKPSFVDGYTTSDAQWHIKKGSVKSSRTSSSHENTSSFVRHRENVGSGGENDTELRISEVEGSSKQWNDTESDIMSDEEGNLVIDMAATGKPPEKSKALIQQVNQLSCERILPPTTTTPIEIGVHQQLINAHSTASQSSNSVHPLDKNLIVIEPCNDLEETFIDGRSNSIALIEKQSDASFITEPSVTENRNTPCTTLPIVVAPSSDSASLPSQQCAPKRVRKRKPDITTKHVPVAKIRRQNIEMPAPSPISISKKTNNQKIIDPPFIPRCESVRHVTPMNFTYRHPNFPTTYSNTTNLNQATYLRYGHPWNSERLPLMAPVNTSNFNSQAPARGGTSTPASSQMPRLYGGFGMQVLRPQSNAQPVQMVNQKIMYTTQGCTSYPTPNPIMLRSNDWGLQPNQMTAVQMIPGVNNTIPLQQQQLINVQKNTVMSSVDNKTPDHSQHSVLQGMNNSQVSLPVFSSNNNYFHSPINLPLLSNGKNNAQVSNLPPFRDESIAPTTTTIGQIRPIIQNVTPKGVGIGAKLPVTHCPIPASTNEDKNANLTVNKCQTVVFKIKDNTTNSDTHSNRVDAKETSENQDTDLFSTKSLERFSAAKLMSGSRSKPVGKALFLLGSSTNLLSQYQPPTPPAWYKGEVPKFPCLECGDVYTKVETLKAHTERQSCVIKYKCDICSDYVFFQNRCTFKEHLRSHQLLKGDYKEMVQTLRIPLMKTRIFSLPDETEEHATNSTNIADPLHDKLVVENSETAKDKVSMDQSVGDNETNEAKDVAPPHSDETSNQINDEADRVTCVDKIPTELQTTVQKDIITEEIKYTCTECQTHFTSPESLFLHFSDMKRIFGQQCHKCLMVLPHFCAFKAHGRIHNRAQPYVCPECGLEFKGCRDIFMQHVKQECLHFNRCYVVSCPKCEVNYSMLGLVQQHIFKVHSSERYYKCEKEGCAIAFRSQKSFESHALQQHGAVGKHKVIFRCPMCEKVFNAEANLKAHLSFHTVSIEKEARYMFKCLICSKVFRNKSFLQAHLLRIHQVNVMPYTCSLCSVKFSDVQSASKHCCVENKEVSNKTCDLTSNKDDESIQIVHKSPTRKTDENLRSSDEDMSETTRDISLECKRCFVRFSDEKLYSRHMNKHLFLERKSKKKSDNSNDGQAETNESDDPGSVSLQDNNELSDEGEDNETELSTENLPTVSPPKEIIAGKTKKSRSLSKKGAYHAGAVLHQVPKRKQHRRYSCSECSDNFEEEDDLDNHLVDAHGISPQFPCHLCSLVFSSSVLLKDHVHSSHETKSLNQEIICICCLRSRKKIRKLTSVASLEKHLIHQHRISKKTLDINLYLPAGQLSEDKGDEDNLEIHPRQMRVSGDSQYSCVKCTYTVDNRQEFLSHITKHNTSNSGAQCQECGLCFTVAKSLKMHLFVVHKVHDFTKYEKDNGVSFEMPVDTKEVSLKMRVNLPPKREITQAKSNLVQADEDKLECTVCYKVFETENILRTHMRTHGMAFIRSRRLFSFDKNK